MKSIIETKDYDFLREDERLADNIILLGYGGSYAYVYVLGYSGKGYHQNIS